jgi:signal transduction histidine kinase/CheY-like chemotaxis protein
VSVERVTSDADATGRYAIQRAPLLDILAAVASMVSGDENEITSALKMIGEAAKVDRMYLFENHTDETTGATSCSQRFEWAHGSVSAEIDNPELQNLAYRDFSDQLESILARGEVFARLTSELEPKFRTLIEPQEIKSLCLVPVKIDGQLWGFVGFDDCHSERRWTLEEIAILRLIASILGGYFSRERIRGALVTERRAAEEALRKRQLDESLSTLAGGIAHDFNNVLHGMMTAAGLLARRHAADEGSAELLSIIRTSGERMSDMTRQLLAYARGGSYERMRLDPVQLVDDALKIGRARIPPDVKLELRSSIEGALVEGDRGQLFQVVLNLVVNAVEAMSDGGTLRIGVGAIGIEPDDALARASVLSAGLYVALTFEDEGVGIDPVILPRIFEPFVSTKSKGRGLGLAASRGIISAHGGAITVESEKGRGSRFRVLLPLHGGSIAEDARALEPRSAEGALLLLCDDDEAVLLATARGLENAGYRVLCARSGREAIDLYDRNRHQIRAVMVDYLMPDMDGAAVIRVLRSRDPKLCTVLCTGYAPADIATAHGIDAVPLLEKPFPLASLLAILGSA